MRRAGRARSRLNCPCGAATWTSSRCRREAASNSPASTYAAWVASVQLNSTLASMSAWPSSAGSGLPSCSPKAAEHGYHGQAAGGGLRLRRAGPGRLGSPRDGAMASGWPDSAKCKAAGAWGVAAASICADARQRRHRSMGACGTSPSCCCAWAAATWPSSCSQAPCCARSSNAASSRRTQSLGVRRVGMGWQASFSLSHRGWRTTPGGGTRCRACRMKDLRPSPN